MTDFDFASAQQKITEINKIVATCPDAVKERAFELLFRLLFDKPVPAAPLQKPLAPKKEEADGGSEKSQPAGPDAVKLPGNVLAFLRRNNVPREALDKLFMLDQTPHLQIYKIETSTISKAQLQKVLMILLENAILSGSFKAPYKEIRESCKEAGLYDSNFNKALKGNASLFKGAVTADKIIDEAQLELTGEGQASLAETITELTATQ
jgi:hypothetical protein